MNVEKYIESIKIKVQKKIDVLYDRANEAYLNWGDTGYQKYITKKERLEDEAVKSENFINSQNEIRLAWSKADNQRAEKEKLILLMKRVQNVLEEEIKYDFPDSHATRRLEDIVNEFKFDILPRNPMKRGREGMNVLEKILEEIEKRKQEHLCNAELEIEETVNGMEELNWVCALIYYMEEVKKANVQTNDDWIPCSKRLPNEEEFAKAHVGEDAAEFLVTIEGATVSTTLYFKNGKWFDERLHHYKVVAWKPLPEPYRAADKPDWKENMLNTFLAGH